MAKAKTSAVPTIKPNSSLMNWLNQESQSIGNPVETESVSKAAVTPEKGDSSVGATGMNTQSNPDEVKVEKLSASEPTQPETAEVNSVSKPADQSPQNNASGSDEHAPVTKKAKAKLVTKSYPDIFFKKPVKSEQDTSASDVKPIRISEDSHWLLSVLVQEARRQGNKLTVGDLIENLLTDHREVHKGVVDELINQWKTRKRIG